MFRLRFAAAAAVLSAAIGAVGCGGSGSASLVGPLGTASASDGATISGTVVTTGGAFTTQSLDRGGIATMGSTGAVQVSVAGTSIGTTTDGQGKFTLTGVPGGDIKLQLSGPGMNGTITLSGVTTSDHIDITISLNNTGARVEHEDRRHEDHGVEVNGRITAIQVSARTFDVGTKHVSVPAAAVIRHGGRTLAFADLKVGDHVEVKGKIDGTTFVASEVKVEQDGEGDDDDDDDDHEMELSGTVSALSGTCPALTFTVRSTKITTNASTTFREITCATVANGTGVEVKGTKQSDGSIIATRVSRD